MKYKKGDKVIFIKKSSKEDSWRLNNYEEYEITNIAHNVSSTSYNIIEGYYYGVKHKDDSETTWYEENDFITIQEYRKLKLNKLNEKTSKL